MFRASCVALSLGVLAAPPGVAATQDALYPAAQCAALWYGYGDYAKASAYLEGEDEAHATADGFYRTAIRLNDGAAAAIDSFVAEQRPLMALMIEAYIYGHDKQSQDLFESLSQICSDFAATQPETRIQP
ncbi:hypothetical protein [Pseudogemmobacter sp. W21_MBD1_M6]|uniref:hypothetical protein n=1 Tax=Pseudogemmobacter sp. W21_MBD1_M6 TaxID=3240271 RepID=UPI003F94AC57